MNIIIITLVWRSLLFAAAALIQASRPFTPQFPYSDIYLLPSGLPSWIWSWANFDGVHYLTIAKSGYMAQFTQAFFPLYPLIVRGLAFIVQDKSLIISGLLLSLISFGFALHFFKKLLLLDYAAPVVWRSVLLLLIFPTSFYFAAFYTESLFLLLVLMAFYYGRKKNWWLSAICISLASASKIMGIFLLPALLLEYFEQNTLIARNSYEYVKKIIIYILKNPLIYIAPIGLIMYLVFLQMEFGDWLYFWHAQPAFGAQRSSSLVFPPQVLWRYIKILLTVTPATPAFLTAVFEAGSYLFSIVLLIFAHRFKIRNSYLLFSWFIIIIPSLTGTLSSMPRYILLAFPIYVVLSRVSKSKLFSVISLILVLFYIFALSNFVSGLWVA